MDGEAKRVAIVTGCGRRNGIGAAVALTLAAGGAAVAVTDLPLERGGAPGRNDELDELVDHLRSTGAEAVGWRGDVASERDCLSVVEQTRDTLGPPTILVNNAGAPHGDDRAFFLNVPSDAWNVQIDVNLTGTFLMTRAAIPHMIASGYGRVVNISSVAGLIGGPNRAAYSASKAGILGLTRALAAELAAQSVTVNAICPGAIATARALSTARRGAGEAGVERALAERAASIPVGRLGTPEDIAAAVAYLASRDAGFVTGQTLVVDGGSSLARS